MKFKKIEYHTVHSHFTYDIPDEDIIKSWGSVERFRQVVSHKNCTSDWDNEPFGEPLTDVEEELWFDFFENHNYDRDDDWFTERKGGYDESYQIIDDDFDANDYDSDSELLN
jgi:hypothetical protein